MARVGPGERSLSPCAQLSLEGLHPESGPSRGSGAAGTEKDSEEAAQEVVGRGKVREKTRGPARPQESERYVRALRGPRKSLRRFEGS